MFTVANQIRDVVAGMFGDALQKIRSMLPVWLGGIKPEVAPAVAALMRKYKINPKDFPDSKAAVEGLAKEMAQQLNVLVEKIEPNPQPARTADVASVASQMAVILSAILSGAAYVVLDKLLDAFSRKHPKEGKDLEQMRDIVQRGKMTPAEEKQFEIEPITASGAHKKHIVEELDKIASEIEPESPIMAMYIDKVADALEDRTATEGTPKDILRGRDVRIPAEFVVRWTKMIGNKPSIGIDTKDRKFSIELTQNAPAVIAEMEESGFFAEYGIFREAMDLAKAAAVKTHYEEMGLQDARPEEWQKHLEQNEFARNAFKALMDDAHYFLEKFTKHIDLAGLMAKHKDVYEEYRKTLAKYPNAIGWMKSPTAFLHDHPDARQAFLGSIRTDPSKIGYLRESAKGSGDDTGNLLADFILGHPDVLKFLKEYDKESEWEGYVSEMKKAEISKKLIGQ